MAPSVTLVTTSICVPRPFPSRTNAHCPDPVPAFHRITPSPLSVLFSSDTDALHFANTCDESPTSIFTCTTPPTATLPILPLSIGSTATHQAVVVSLGMPPATTGSCSNWPVAVSLLPGVISMPVIASTPHRSIFDPVLFFAITHV